MVGTFYSSPSPDANPFVDGNKELDPVALDANSSTFQFASQSTGVKAVDGLNFTYGFVGGTLDGVANGMGLISLSTAIPHFSSFAV